MWETESSRFVENENPRFSFCEKPESENFFLSENSRFVENGNWRFLVLWKIRIGEFFSFFFLTQNSRFVENGN